MKYGKIRLITSTAAGNRISAKRTIRSGSKDKNMATQYFSIADA